nr:RNA-directed DNA polymerase, eukaryota [Tanacetum cinerariifolium]
MIFMGIDDWKDVTSRKHRHSKDDEVIKISKLVFVTNFPESISARNLWKSCTVYGTVVDVLIPSKKSNAGKIFAFVRFIKVFNLDRLVENLCTIWIGKFHLFANKVRIERPHKPNVSATNNSGVASRTEKPFNSQQINNGVGSYANIVNGISTGMQTPVISSSPALVLDDSCLIDRDLSNHVLGKVKELSSIPNLHTILKDEGFSDVKVSYIGGLWVLLKLTSMDTKLNLMNHIDVKSTKKEWIKALTNSFKLNFLAIQETKMTSISHMDVKFLWGNSNYDYVYSESLGNSGGILCVWEASIFKKINITVSDNFIAIYGTWLPTNSKILFIAIYAPQQTSCKRKLWDCISTIVDRWNGESIIMGDFNEVRSSEEWRGACFNPYSARYFDRFISNAGLVDVTLEGYAFTWAHPSASKMSKLDRFLVSDGIFSLFPSITTICLDRHLSNHRPILLREVKLDFGPTPFRFYHSWFDYVGFDDMIKLSWHSFSHSDTNGMIREIDKDIDHGIFDDDTVFRRFELKHKLLNVSEMESKDNFQKSKLKWAVEGDENSKLFHGIINKRRAQLAIRGIFVDGF